MFYFKLGISRGCVIVGISQGCVIVGISRGCVIVGISQGCGIGEYCFTVSFQTAISLFYSYHYD